MHSNHTFAMGGSDHRNHTVLGRKLETCPRWRVRLPRRASVLSARHYPHVIIRTS
jgi:hypothetical protein